jgi:hypothetical protein
METKVKDISKTIWRVISVFVLHESSQEICELFIQSHVPSGIIDKGDYSVDWKGMKIPITVGVYDFVNEESALKCENILHSIYSKTTKCISESHCHNQTIISSNIGEECLYRYSVLLLHAPSTISIDLDPPS